MNQQQHQQKQHERPLLYTVEQTQRTLSISRSTVNRFVNAGKLTKVKLGPGSVRITTDSIYGLLGMA
jgi:excisionase family DNA binding protein